jgi:lipoyl-dependent peroxiredoxin
MPMRKSCAVWEGRLKDGTGTLSLGEGAFELPYSFASRFQEGAGSNPEEMLAAAHAGCFSMALAHRLSQAGFAPIRVQTTARVHLDRQGEGFAITQIDLETEADVPDISEDDFLTHAQDAKANCPVSKALATEITLNARLTGSLVGAAKASPGKDAD